MLSGLYDREEVMEKLNRGAFRVGMKEAVKKGLEKGIKQGRKEGREEEKLLTAKNMLNKKLDINLISEVTGLSISDINNIK